VTVAVEEAAARRVDWRTALCALLSAVTPVDCLSVSPLSAFRFPIRPVPSAASASRADPSAAAAGALLFSSLTVFTIYSVPHCHQGDL